MNELQKTSRAWTFTLNNPKKHIDWDDDNDKKIRYAIYQYEIGKEGTPHFQGYIEMNEPVRGTYIVNNIRSMRKSHLEVRKKTRDQAREYCRKQDDTYLEGPWEYGTWDEKGQGSRNDIYQLKQDIDDGMDITEVQDEYFGLWLRNYNAINIYMESRLKDEITKYAMDTFNRPPLDFDGKTCWMIYGESGTGKTSYALSHFKNPLLCSHLEDLKKLRPKFHDGIVFDDMSFKHLPAETGIAVTDVENSRSIFNRHHNARIPKGFKRIIVHNYKEAIYSDKILERQIVAIDRRTKFLQVHNSLKKIL